MSPKPFLISGRRLVQLLKRLGYEKLNQKGSHIKMRNTSTGSVVIVPDHKELDRWTLKTILRQAEIPDKVFNDMLQK
ncbi:MAG: type II toxin-antitoxin system HicA family toxin [Pseudomonadota bacterium]